MPPKPKRLSKHKSEVKKLESGDETIKSFFSLDGAALALKSNDWQIQCNNFVVSLRILPRSMD